MRFFASLWVASFAVATPAVAAQFRVKDAAGLAEAARRAKPGDAIVMANGTWKNQQLVFAARGTADKPVLLIAETKGKVVLTGQSNLKIAGEHLVVSSLVFRDGYSPTKEVIAFRTESTNYANHVRLSEVVIDRFNKPDRRAEDIWVALYGADNRVDHSFFSGKGNAGVTLAVIRPRGDPRENRHRIDGNYFGPRPPLGSNGGETIRVGTSEESLSDSKTVVERNVFDNCDGEVEIISIKSGRNIIRENTILRSQGSIVLRHGNGNLVERNVFLNGGKDSTGGIRVINRDQVVRGNYIEGSTGTSFLSAIAVMNGVPDSPINRYHQVANAVIEGNSVIAPAQITLGAGADAERSAPPIDSRFTANLITGDKDPFRLEAAGGIAFSGNIASFAAPAAIAAGFKREPAKLTRAGNGLLYPDGEKWGAPRDLKPVARDAAGPDWYAKPAAETAFGAGRERKVAPGAGTLEQAAASAGTGDTLRLVAGDYPVAAPIALDRALTVAGGRDSRIAFAAPTLFQLNPGGSVRIAGLSISGKGAPAANAVVRAAPVPTPVGYAVEIDDAAIADVGDVIATTPGTFASHAAVRKSSFARVAGAVVAAAAETGREGYYGIEAITLADSDFSDVARVADVARLGTDESTFGPAFTLSSSRVTGGGPVAVRLSGAQRVAITGNTFTRAGGIEIAHSVGAPRVTIIGNRFIASAMPKLSKLYPQGSPIVTLADNKVSSQ
ncbi:MAG: polysaccharide lyase 6 family protein [Pseudomonadota bacterium]